MMIMKLAMIAMIVSFSASIPLDGQNFVLIKERHSLKITEYRASVKNAEVMKNAVITKMQAQKKTAQFINEDKTYEQCMNEAFERIYEEVNNMLDRLAEQRNE